MAPPTAHVPLRHKVAFGIGAIAYGVKDNGFSVFLLLFYNQVVGLDAGVVGAAIMAALVLDAFIDPIIGVLSDRTDTSWGRRLPWIYASALPMMLAWWLLWHPPTGASHAATLGWLFVCAVSVRTALAMNEVPSMALGPELTRDYHERTLLTRWRYILGWIAGLVMLMLAFGVFVPAGRAPAAMRTGYEGYALLGTMVMGASIVLSAAMLHKRMAHRSSYSIKRESVGEVARGMRRGYANPAFLWLLAAGVAAFVGQGVAFALTNYLLDYVWRFPIAAKLVYALALFVGVLGAFLIVAPLGKRFNKRDLAGVTGVLAAVIGTFPYALRLAGVLPADGSGATQPVFMTTTVLSNACGVITIMLIPSMMGDVVEADQIRSGRREEGLFGAGFMFMQKAATGVGIFVSGLMLSYARFPARGVPGQVDVAVLDRLNLAVIVVLVGLSLVAALAFRRFPFGRAEHDARLTELSEVPG